MGRRVKIRVSYTDDANFLHRLADAVSSDVRRTENWRKATSLLLTTANMLLIMAETSTGEKMAIETLGKFNGKKRSIPLKSTKRK